VVVGFLAEWCIPCHMAVPVLETAAIRYKGRVKVGAVDFDENPALAERYGVQGLPAVVVLKGGAPAERRIGLMGRKSLDELVGRYAGKA
jgi:thioredoxin